MEFLQQFLSKKTKPSKPAGFRASDFLLTPKDAWVGLRRLATAISHASLRDVNGVLLLMLTAFSLYWFSTISVEGIVFWIFIVVLFYWKLDSRIAIGAALGLLVLIPFMLWLHSIDILIYGEIWAERVAVWVYYFLVIGVVKQIVEYKQEQKKSPPKHTVRKTKQRKISVTDINV